MITFAIGAAIMALLMLLLSWVMAEDTGVVISDTKVYHGGGDPAIIHLQATAAITPGDNVEPVSTYGVKTCDNSAEEFIGTADTNDKGGALAGSEPISTNYASGDVVPVITGACHVRKIAEGTIHAGYAVRPGTSDGGACLEQTTTHRYTIGRSLTYNTDGGAILVKQY
jgi:hypothetical protein